MNVLKPILIGLVIGCVAYAVGYGAGYVLFHSDEQKQQAQIQSLESSYSSLK